MLLAVIVVLINYNMVAWSQTGATGYRSELVWKKRCSVDDDSVFKNAQIVAQMHTDMHTPFCR